MSIPLQSWILARDVVGDEYDDRIRHAVILPSEPLRRSPETGPSGYASRLNSGSARPTRSRRRLKVWCEIPSDSAAGRNPPRVQRVVRPAIPSPFSAIAIVRFRHRPRYAPGRWGP